MSSAPTALTTKSSIRCTRTPISHYGSITNCAIGNTPTTACALTSRSPTSLLWNSSPVGNFIGERQSVTNLLDEYTLFASAGPGGMLTSSQEASCLEFLRSRSQFWLLLWQALSPPNNPSPSAPPPPLPAKKPPAILKFLLVWTPPLASPSSS